MQVLSQSSLSQISGGHISIKEKDNKMLLISLSDNNDFFKFNTLTFTVMGCFNEQGLQVNNQDIYGEYRVANPEGYWMNLSLNYLLIPVKV